LGNDRRYSRLINVDLEEVHLAKNAFHRQVPSSRNHPYPHKTFAITTWIVDVKASKGKVGAHIFVFLAKLFVDWSNDFACTHAALSQVCHMSVGNIAHPQKIRISDC
jgi:hypothetical protein